MMLVFKCDQCNKIVFYIYTLTLYRQPINKKSYLDTNTLKRHQTKPRLTVFSYHNNCKRRYHVPANECKCKNDFLALGLLCFALLCTLEQEPAMRQQLSTSLNDINKHPFTRQGRNESKWRGVEMSIAQTQGAQFWARLQGNNFSSKDACSLKHEVNKNVNICSLIVKQFYLKLHQLWGCCPAQLIDV